MKRRIALVMDLLVVSGLALGGCSSPSQPPVSEKATAAAVTIVPVVASPSPTPTASLPAATPTPRQETELIPASCYREGLPTYVNRETGVCFAYPQRFAVGNEDQGQPTVLGPALDKSLDPLRATLTVQVRPTQVKNLGDLISSYAAETKTALETKLDSLTLDGETARVLDPTRGRANGRSVLLLFNSKLYVLLFTPSLKNTPAAQQTAVWKQGEKDMQALYEIVTASFGFLSKARQVGANDMLALPSPCLKNTRTIYVDAEAQYCMAMPNGFVVGATNPGQRALWGPALDASADPLRATLAVDVKSVPVNSTVETLADEFAKANPSASVTRSTTQIAGKPAAMFRNVPARGNSANILVVDRSRLYNLYFQPDSNAKAKADLDRLLASTMNSFSFLPSTN